MKNMKILFQVLAVCAFLSGNSVEAHSWLENIKVVSGSLFTANSPVGYIRNYVGRQSTTVDVDTTNRILSINTGVNVCKSNQQSPGQLPGLPKLSAYPNDLILGTYLENGHIWKELEHVDPDGAKSGTIYWYGTQNPKPDRTIDSVLNWTMDGTGGDKQGKLLATTNFDDGTCIETGQEAKTGRKGGPCKSYVRLPKEAEPGQDYTVYWLWDYSLHFGYYQTEWYSCCMDISILQKPGNSNSKTSAAGSGSSVALGTPLSVGTPENAGSTAPYGIIQEFPKVKRGGEIMKTISAKFRGRI